MQNRYGVDIEGLQKKLNRFTLIFGLLAPIGYLGVVYLLESGGKDSPIVAKEIPLLLWILTIVSITAALAQPIARKYFFGRSFIQSRESFASNFEGRYFTNWIIMFAFLESMSIVGLDHYFIGGFVGRAIAGCGATMLACLIYRPTESFLRETLAAQERFIDSGNFATPKQSR